MKETLEASESGKSTFPQVVGKLVAAGVESYFADLVRSEETFYMPGSEIHVEKLSLPLGKIADEFSQSGIVSAIRAAQSDEIRYPEFVKRARAAGVAAYWAFLAGKKWCISAGKASSTRKNSLARKCEQPSVRRSSKRADL